MNKLSLMFIFCVKLCLGLFFLQFLIAGNTTCSVRGPLSYFLFICQYSAQNAVHTVGQSGQDFNPEPARCCSTRSSNIPPEMVKIHVLLI